MGITSETHFVSYIADEDSYDIYLFFAINNKQGTKFEPLHPPRWEDPLGNTHFVTYVADEDGYRVVDSDVIPATVAGVRADGNQVSSLKLIQLFVRFNYFILQFISSHFLTYSYTEFSFNIHDQNNHYDADFC